MPPARAKRSLIGCVRGWPTTAICWHPANRRPRPAGARGGGAQSATRPRSGANARSGANEPSAPSCALPNSTAGRKPYARPASACRTSRRDWLGSAIGVLSDLESAERARGLAADKVLEAESAQQASERALRAAEATLVEHREARSRAEAAVQASLEEFGQLRVLAAERAAATGIAG